MDNKYYTPSIEEFHHGYECEIYWNPGYEVEKWEAFTFEVKDKDGVYLNMGNTIEMIEDGCSFARTKYLDKEDIESLGWIRNTVVDSEDNIGFKREDGKSMMRYNTKDHIAWIQRIPTDFGVTIFQSILKNKSELKVLMNQLNIK